MPLIHPSRSGSKPWSASKFGLYSQYMDIKDVEKLAEMARIELSEEEKKKILSDMGSILEYVKDIEKVEVGNVKLDYQRYNVWREDELKPREFSRDLILKQFPHSQDGFLKVKKIL